MATPARGGLGDLHNLVFQRDYRIIPAIVSGWTP
jgi:hypothetical protein